ncbi:MAG: putative T4-like protein proximal tail fiber [Parcubacteria group bacterium GW2011_GWA1_47_8]|nr:MAG: putative T4-like protein proximal tail fiber [Parcubacteria group bacterium GW2011_GWA1_47_8]
MSGVGTSTFAGGLEVWRQIASPYFHATSTTATSTFGDINIATANTRDNWVYWGGTKFISASSTKYNTFVGFDAGSSMRSGITNTFVGYQAGKANTTGSDNTANGVSALYTNTTGSSNTANGSGALLNNSTGSSNTASGFNALWKNTTGSSNIANGYFALLNNTTGSNNTALGYQAGYNVTTSHFNIALGYQSGYNVNTGYDNIFIGHDANTGGGGSITTGYNNIGLGYNIKFPAVSSNNMLNIGNFLFANLPATTTVTTIDNTPLTGKLGVGTSTPYAKLTVWGADTLPTSKAFEIADSASTTLFSVLNNGNVGIGTSTTATSTFGDINIATANTRDNWVYWGGTKFISASSTKYNTFVGLGAGTSTQSAGSDNTFLGYWAGQANTTGDYNTAIGSYALRNNTTGEGNSAFGDYSLAFNTTGISNMGFGSGALYLNTTGNYNVAVGRTALRGNDAGTNSGNRNIAIGFQSLYINDTGSSNTAIGHKALFSNTTGASSTALGAWAGYTNTTGTRNLFLGDEADASVGTLTNATAIGSHAIVGASNSLVLGGTGSYAVNVGIGTTSPWRTLSVVGTVAFNGLTLNTGAAVASVCLTSTNDVTRNTDNESCITSSKRFKHDIEDIDTGYALSELSLLRPITFEYNETLGTRYGFIAEEVDKIDTRLVGYDDQGRPNSVRYTSIIPLLTQGIQELNLNLQTVASTTIAGTVENYQAFENDLDTGDIAAISRTNTTATTSAEAFGVKKGGKGSIAIGIVSMGKKLSFMQDGGAVPVVLSGHVPVKVALEGGDIKEGDRIALSSVAGVGMKATSTAQTTVGIALEDFDASSPKDANGVGKVTVFVNLAYTKLDPALSSGTVNPSDSASSAFWSIDNSSGRIKFANALDINDFDMVNVKAIRGSADKWSIDASGRMVVEDLEVRGTAKIGSPERRTGITLYDELSGAPYCLSISGGVTKTTSGECASAGASQAASASGTSGTSGGSGSTPSVVDTTTTTTTPETTSTTTPTTTGDTAGTTSDTSAGGVTTSTDTLLPAITTDTTTLSGNLPLGGSASKW